MEQRLQTEVVEIYNKMQILNDMSTLLKQYSSILTELIIKSKIQARKKGFFGKWCRELQRRNKSTFTIENNTKDGVSVTRQSTFIALTSQRFFGNALVCAQTRYAIFDRNVAESMRNGLMHHSNFPTEIFLFFFFCRTHPTYSVPSL